MKADERLGDVVTTSQVNKKPSYRRVTARCVLSEFLYGLCSTSHNGTFQLLYLNPNTNVNVLILRSQNVLIFFNFPAVWRCLSYRGNAGG